MTGAEITDWFEKYYKDIYHFLIYYTHSPDVEDMVQEVFIRAIEGVDNYKRESNPKTWLFSIARHIAIDEMRKSKRAKLKHLNIVEKATEQIDKTTPEDVLRLNERNKLLYQLIQSLKVSYRDVIVLRGIKQLSVAEVASILNCNENKVRVTFHRAISALQKEKERFLDEA